MIPHLQNVLETIPPSVAVSAVLGRWDRTMWKAVSNLDIEPALRFPDPDPWGPPNSTIPHSIFQQPEGINLLFYHQCWVEGTAHPLLPYYLDTLLGSVRHADLQRSTGLRFVIPFSVVDTLWTREEPTARAKSLTLLSLFEQSWEPCPGYDEERHDKERWAFMRALADHINRKDRVSALLTSKRGQAFIRYIHNEAIARRLSDGPYLIDSWPQAIERALKVGSLPSDYFAPIPRLWEEDPSTLPDLDPVRYSIETEQDVQVDNDQVLDILTSNGVGDAFGVGPSEKAPIEHPQNFSTHNVHVNANASLGARGVDTMIPDHESGADGTGRPTGNQEDFIANVDGNRIRQDNTQGDTMKGLGSAKQINTGMLGDSTGEFSDIAGG
ncbi:hypothetical protein Moror_1949 [Moniliophthora roreri MCA 2997]|uniref:Uncharacterized protein n=1 Tax=Moniliophthora roreri (strain MCA 2997) TaxID=1381753 RepID=V2X481_MONRO|nr:hypothetical protein Moror_1949 [Moniliophthora roreri MCA 2997]